MLNVMKKNSTLMFPWIVGRGKACILNPKTEGAGVLRLSGGSGRQTEGV